MDAPTFRKFNRSIELWRRQTKNNAPTKELTQTLLDQLSADGFSVQESVDEQAMVSALTAMGYTVTPPNDQAHIQVSN